MSAAGDVAAWWRDALESLRGAVVGSGTDAVVLAGAAALALGLLGAVASLAPARRRSGSRSLAALRQSPGDAADATALELARPFTERVLEPGRRAAIRLGRRYTPASQLARSERRLALAGHPPGWDVDRVVALQVLGAAFAAALGVLAALVADGGLLRAVGLALLGAVAGWLVPAYAVRQMATSRSERLRRDLPDTLDLLTISVEAGLGFDAAVGQVARRVRGPLAREFARVLQEMQIGTGRAEALRTLGERTDVADLKSFASAVTQADTFGVPLARALRIQADELRVRRRQRVEEKAQQVPVKILFPLILGILPVLFIAIIGPAAIQTIRNLGGLGG